MFSFRTSFCCCGCPLRGGTIALLVTDLIFYLYLLIRCLISDGDTTADYPEVDMEMDGEVRIPTLIKAVLLGITVAGLYGISEKKAAFLIPHIVTQVLTMIVIGFLIFGLLFARSLLLDMIKSASDQNSFVPKPDFSALDSVFFFFIFVFIIVFGIQYHFFLVVLSYYFQLKEERDSAPIAMTVRPEIVIRNNSQYP